MKLKALFHEDDGFRTFLKAGLALLVVGAVFAAWKSWRVEAPLRVFGEFIATILVWLVPAVLIAWAVAQIKRWVDRKWGEWAALVCAALASVVLVVPVLVARIYAPVPAWMAEKEKIVMEAARKLQLENYLVWDLKW